MTIIILSVVLVICAALMLLIILMQRPKQEGLGASFGGGMTQDLFGAQTTNVLQKATTYLAVIFFVVSMILAILFNRQAEAAKSTEGLNLSDAVPAVEQTAEESGMGGAPAAEGTEEATPAEETPAEEAPSEEAAAPEAEATEGTAQRAAIEGLEVSGQTGTAQTAEEAAETGAAIGAAAGEAVAPAEENAGE